MFDSIFWFKAFELIASLSILVFVHELGHFMWSRIFKVGVEKFYLFFDAYDFALVRWNKQGLHFFDFFHFPRFVNPSETEYGIGWLPLGGYCAIMGMVDETHNADDIKGMEGDNLFVKKSKFAQFMILVGGVLNNLLLAIVVYIGMSWHYGREILEPQNIPNGVTYSEYAHSIGFAEGDMIVATDGQPLSDFNQLGSALLLANTITVVRDGQQVEISLPDTLGTYFLSNPEALPLFVQPCIPFVLAQVPDESPAAQAGMLAGDSIVMIDSIAMPFAHQVRNYLSTHAGDTIMVSAIRGLETMTFPVALTTDGKLGVYQRTGLPQSCFTHLDFTLLEAIPDGINRGWTMLYNYVRQFKLVFTKEGAQQVGGFGAMGNLFPQTWSWYDFWRLTAFISVALAFMNIIPIPGLDGGHILILIIEAIIRRPLSDKFKERLQYVGFALILLLMVAVNANDIIKYFFK